MPETQNPEYAISKEETKECLSGALSLAECNAAQKDLGLKWTNVLTNRKYPKGCYVNQGRYVYFNISKTGGSSSTRRNICQKGEMEKIKQSSVLLTEDSLDLQEKTSTYSALVFSPVMFVFML